MASLQTLQHKLASLQEQYDLTASKLKAIGRQRAIETDVSERFKLDEDMKQAEADLDRLGQAIDELAQKIQAIDAGQVKLNDVLKQEGLQSAGKQVHLRQQLIALTAVGVVGVGAVGIWAGSRFNPRTKPAEHIANISPLLTQKTIGIFVNAKPTTPVDAPNISVVPVNVTPTPPISPKESPKESLEENSNFKFDVVYKAGSKKAQEADLIYKTLKDKGYTALKPPTSTDYCSSGEERVRDEYPKLGNVVIAYQEKGEKKIESVKKLLEETLTLALPIPSSPGVRGSSDIKIYLFDGAINCSKGGTTRVNLSDRK